MRVQNDAKERATAGEVVGADESAAVGELWIISQHGADSCEYGVGGVAEELDLVACGGSGEPVGLIWKAGGRWGGEFAVDRERGL